MSAQLLDCIEVCTASSCEYAVIWLHGLGASGNDFEPIVPELQLGGSPGVRFVFPHAPIRPITINGGASMRGWYDIDSLDFGSRQQDVQSENIVLAGFSQGGAIALYTGLTSAHKLAGIMALSTYLPIDDETMQQLTEHGKKLPLLMAHGQYDEVIQIRHAQHSKSILEANGIQVKWHTYPIPHSVSAEEIHDISVWLKQQIS